MKYRPLTPLQQEKYDEYKGTKRGGKKRQQETMSRPVPVPKAEPKKKLPDATMEFTELPDSVLSMDEAMAALPDEQADVENDATRRLPTGELTAALAAMENESMAVQDEEPEESGADEALLNEEEFEEASLEEEDFEEVSPEEASLEEELSEGLKAPEKKSSITTVVKGATLEEALANGVAMANGINQEEKKRMAQREEEIRISGQMKIEDILQEWEEKSCGGGCKAGSREKSSRRGCTERSREESRERGGREKSGEEKSFTRGSEYKEETGVIGRYQTIG